MIVCACDHFVDLGCHVFADGSTCERGALTYAFVKESTAWIQYGTIQRIQINFFDQLSFVPKFNFCLIVGMLCFLFHGLHFCSFLIPCFQQSRNNSFKLCGKHGAIGTDHDGISAFKYHFVNFCTTFYLCSTIFPINGDGLISSLGHHIFILQTAKFVFPCCCK